MAQHDDTDPNGKVIHLFPGQQRDDRMGPVREPGFDWQDANALEREIRGVLGDARRDETAEGSSAPDPSHRNAVRCPQCDRFTWKRTPLCRHCGADLAAYSAERRHALLWCVAIASWGLALGCFYLTRQYVLPPRIHAVLKAGGLAIAGANAFGFWIASQGKSN